MPSVARGVLVTVISLRCFKDCFCQFPNIAQLCCGIWQHYLFLNPFTAAEVLHLKAEHLQWTQLFEKMVLIKGRSGVASINNKALPRQLQPGFS